MKRDLFWVLVLEGLVGLQKPSNFSFFSITGWGIALDYCDFERFAFIILSVVFEIMPKNCILDPFLDLLFAAKDREALYIQRKQDWELTVAQIMNSLLQTSGLNWRKQGKLLGHSDMT